MIDRAAFRKKLTKENMIVLALLGLLLMVIAIPVKNKEEEQPESGLMDTESGIIGTEAAAEVSEEEAYAGKLEERLEELLESMEGVGRVQVMVTVTSSREQVVEKDIPSSMDSTKETDSAGGTRDTVNSQQQESTVYVTEADGSRTPYVVRTLEPEVEGVTVVAEGGGNALIQKNITEVIQALFDVEAHKIRVVKMK